MSARPCGCDPEAHWICERHQDQRCCDGNDPECKVHGVRASNARQNQFLRDYDRKREERHK